MKVEVAGATHVGRVRSINEDAYLASPRLAVVADGMGGHACGDVASALAITTFEQHAAEIDDPSAVAETVRLANEAILSEVADHPERAGMGTTVTGVALIDRPGSPHWLVFNVGDSRVYRIADGAAHQLTVDHSETAELVAAGMITAAEARTHPLRHVITRALGAAATASSDSWLVPVAVGDVLLACSDGLTDELLDDQIALLVEGHPDLQAAATSLVDAAVAAGGHDNVTVVLLAAREDGDDAAMVTTTAMTVPRAKATEAAR